MRMGVPRIEMIRGDPVEAGAQIFLHLGHEAPGQRPEVGKLIAILGRQDEAELMSIAIGALEKGLAIRHIRIAPIESAGRPVAGHAVALDLAKMGPSGAKPLAGKPNQPRFDDRPAAARPSEQAACAKDAAGRRTAANPAAFEAPTAQSPRPARHGGRHDNLPQKPWGAPVGPVLYPAKLRFEFVLSHALDEVSSGNLLVGPPSVIGASAVTSVSLATEGEECLECSASSLQRMFLLCSSTLGTCCEQAESMS